MDSFDSSIGSIDVSLTSSINTTKISIDATQENESFPENNFEETFVDRIIIHYLKHNLSLVCLEDLMQLMNESRETCDKFPTHKKQIIKLFFEGRDLIEIFYFVKCKKCGKIVKISSQNLEKVKCCDVILQKTETNFFVYMPLRKQISQSLKKNWTYIQRFDTTDKNTGCYSDAHDGEILKNVLKQYEGGDVNILSLCLNLDGANRFNSNKLSLWPIQFTQNYLPPKIRFLADNIILSGLMYTEGSINFRDYLLPLVEELSELNENKIELNIDGKDYVFKPVVTHGCFDLPAKSKVQETKQYGGYDGCSYCEIPGELVVIKNSNDVKKGWKKNNNPKQKQKNGKNQEQNGEEEKLQKGVRYVEGSNSYPLRDEKETLKKMLLASSKSDDVDGIKDISCLVGLEHFNIVESVGVEYMHCVLLGVQKQLTNFFCNSNYSDSKFYITPEKRKLLNKRILAIRPTSDVVRKPRSLDKRSDFKASEHRFMLLYYFPVCLAGCVPNEFVEHVRLLSAAVYILLQSSIPKDEVDEAEKMLHKFVKQHQQLFGKKHMVMVIHLLKHLAQSVRKLGPAWSHSAFPFERNNGNLLKMVRGTTDVLLQISSKYCLSKAVTHNPITKSNKSEKVLLGKSMDIEEKSLRVFNLVTLNELNLSNTTLSVYKRINLSKIIYTSKLYTRPKKSIDYFIGVQNNMMGMAKFYIEYNSETFVVIEEFEIVDYIHHIFKVQPTNRNIMAPINDIKLKYIYMKVGLNSYIASSPNTYEKE